MINRRTVLKTAAVGAAQAVALPYLAREGFAQTAAHVLKLTMADTRNHPLYQVLLRFADNVKKKTNGAIEVQVYGTGELGSQLNILTGLQTGIIDLCAHTVSYTHLRAHETPEHLVCRLLLEKHKTPEHLVCRLLLEKKKNTEKKVNKLMN